MRRLISPAPFILKGEGWYVTDYPSAARKKAMESEKGGSDKSAPSSPKSGEASSSGDKTSSGDKPSSTPSNSSSASTSSGSPAD